MAHKAKIGEIQVVLRGRQWCLYKVDSVNDKGEAMGAFPTGECFYDRKEALRRAFELNNWKIPAGGFR